ncbi:hypothetical protein [Massilia eurypsychrophila]|uniref:hypothetical protein n=1 Tax=Massilia eurypsychrophila TaxID=1485217 RepID=UPI0010351757|nr:hypothetical protein [Massilia eurypsychrophila]
MTLLSKLNSALAAATLTFAEIAAAQPSALVVRIHYVVSERSADRVEKILTSPLERALRALPRIVKMRSATGNMAKGVTVDLQLHFEGGATAQDLAMVLTQVAKQEIENIDTSSVAVHRMPPSVDNDADLLLR